MGGDRDMKVGKKITDGFEEFIIQEVLPVGFTDITSASNFVKVGDYLFHDYKRVRKNLQGMDFSLLSEEEKMLTCQYRATNEANCKAILGSSFDFWITYFDLKSIACRRERFSLLKTVLIKNVSLMDRYNTMGFLNTTKLENDYLNYGIEGISAGDPIEGILDFINSAGTYIATGVSVRPYTMVGDITKEVMVVQLNNVIANGTINT